MGINPKGEANLNPTNPENDRTIHLAQSRRGAEKSIKYGWITRIDEII